ncbi:hypothetical protein EUX98_g9720 [Antrodiella citrinella]|uniref:Hemerythrin-like domain-containing protein n=1 Tax=Antrodiella citrinella TaxID=2447956 RepID=A0A4S4LMW4_9APHY|nr:hypothetical protein EUX98_g9720 [Antrodiella citrinella]
MAGAHAFIINALLDIYEKSPSIPEEKYDDFVGYALQWVAVLHHHHSWEEEHYYPMFTHKYDTSFIVAEHEGFSAALTEMEEYLISCLPSGAPHGYGKVAPIHEQQVFNASYLLSLIDKNLRASFLACKHHVSYLVMSLILIPPFFFIKLLQEVTYLHSDRLHESGFTEAEIRHIAAETNKYMMNMPMTTFLVYVTLLSPKGSDFPPAPSFVKRYVVPYVLYWPNRRLWQFAPKA